jgi:hypothetical protein
MSSILMILALTMGLDPEAGATASRADDNPIVVIDTSMGPITVALDAKNSPKTTENFLRYVDDKFFDGLTFHRVIPGFMIQGGGLDENLREKEEGKRPPIRNEHGNGLNNDKGTIAMARPASSSSTIRTMRSSTREQGTPFSARSSTGWTWSTRSPACARAPSARRTEGVRWAMSRSIRSSSRAFGGRTRVSGSWGGKTRPGGTLDRPRRGL